MQCLCRDWYRESASVYKSSPPGRKTGFSDAWGLPPHCVLDILGLLFHLLSTDELNLGCVFQVAYRICHSSLRRERASGPRQFS